MIQFQENAQTGKRVPEGLTEEWTTKWKLLHFLSTDHTLLQYLWELKKLLWPLFMDGFQLPQGYRATMRRQYARITMCTALLLVWWISLNILNKSITKCQLFHCGGHAGLNNLCTSDGTKSSIFKVKNWCPNSQVNSRDKFVHLWF